MHYRLDDRAAKNRAGIVAAVGTAQALSPAVLVVVLVHKLGYVSAPVASIGGVVLVALAFLRGAIEFGRVARRLAAFSVEGDGTGLVLVATGGREVLGWGELARVSEIGGSQGGLRLETEDGRYDIPRGGEEFGELRALIDAHVKVERAPRRRRLVRVGLGVAVVLAMFFLPFAIDDVMGRSRVAAVGIIALVWGALLVLRRK